LYVSNHPQAIQKLHHKFDNYEILVCNALFYKFKIEGIATLLLFLIIVHNASNDQDKYHKIFM